ncbi:xanthine dehydrogenase family protein molybdopterin-binding subunit [Oricola cellulosilytica]|uniref:Xanthine dehydrogenase family protein molybdopterin-binding subunit n=1 Tax=Oricola cellulosilytica TaxID=1429082 RepID=A0A4R0PD56_9HYPH|nr:xanthine dehydrogenase family protein molybdopterin-binding subunit [Oricola cellulosilytica]TCD14145.1 xanthine dehydrogenase family protein molybdopterin-binding subunit [Oricola cellulosilytica]
MNVAPPRFGSKSLVGSPLRRKEDDAFVRGAGCYTGDIAKENMLHAVVVRSPMASGSFVIDSLDEALAASGVKLILTAEDVAHMSDLPAMGMRKGPDGIKAPYRNIPVLCRDKVRYVGDAIAFVVAETVEQARDAAELLEISFEGAEAVIDTGEALADGAPPVWPDADSNRAYVNTLGDADATAEAFKNAHHVTVIDFVQNRLVSNYMETRAAIGDWDGERNRYTLTVGSQGVHGTRDIVSRILGDDAELRVITPDVGGGFGPKGFVYREYPLVLEAAKRLGRPVRWVGDRTEHFLTDAHGRDNVVHAEMAMDGEGRFLGLRIDLTAAMGAYTHQFGVAIPWFGVTMSTGVYDIPALDFTLTGVFTHTCPVDAYRGAGRPEAAFLIETLVDACARDMQLAPDEIRRRNFIRPDQMPYRTPGGRLYDVGEFAGHMDRAMENADWAGFPARLETSKARGRVRGIGMASYIEACAFAGSEPAFVALQDDGTVTVDIGTQSNGQGHATAYAQFVAETIGLDINAVEVIQGDTDRIAKGGGTGGSRSIPLGGVSAYRAGEALATKIRKIASEELEASPDDIELSGGQAVVAGTDKAISLADIAKAATDPADLKAEAEFKQDEATYPNGTHICEVEIDPATGIAEVVRYTIVDDFGMTVNPMLLAGQVHGGVVQGIGQALLEQTVYDETGQLLTASFMDYALPRAGDVPNFSFETRNVPSITNALGIKGAGEAGTIGAAPAAMNAVTDALYRAYGVTHINMPATPAAVWEAIRRARE